MNNVIYECTSSDFGFSYVRKSAAVVHEKSNPPHTHKDLIEIFMLISGNVEYVIEGNHFHVNPYDVILVNNNELHRSIAKANSTFECILLSINLDFFIKNNCNDFNGIVLDRKIGTNNIIPAKTVITGDIYDNFMRIEKYVKEKPICYTVVRSVIIELLYNLNKLVTKAENTTHSQKNVKNIMEYIDLHLTDDLSLDAIANHFFMTKQYICKIFKFDTGFTIKKYISYKRIVLVRELYSSGLTLSEACIRAGFNDYSNFYRTFTKLMHEPPKKNLSNIKFRFENSGTQNSSNF